MRDSRATRGQPPSHQAHLRARRPLRTGKWPHEERVEWTSRRRNAGFMYAPKVPVQRNGLVSTLARPSYTCHKSINSPSYKGGARVRPLLLSQRLSYLSSQPGRSRRRPSFRTGIALARGVWFARRFMSPIPAQFRWRHVALFEVRDIRARERIHSALCDLPNAALSVPVNCDEALGRE